MTEIEKCDCCKGKMVPEKFWTNDFSNKEANGECRGSVSEKGFCKAFSNSEVEAFEESLATHKE